MFVCKSFDLHVRIDKKIRDISLFEYGDESHTIIKYSQEERNAVILCDQEEIANKLSKKRIRSQSFTLYSTIKV